MVTTTYTGHTDYAKEDQSGNDWECNPGYQRVADACQSVWAQLLKPGAQMQLATSPPELEKMVRQIQQHLKQAGYDPGPIDGILGPKTLMALQQYLATQAHVFVQDKPIQPHPPKGDKG